MTSENLPTLLFESFQVHDLDRWYQALSNDFEASYPNARQGLNKEDALAYNQPFEKDFLIYVLNSAIVQPVVI